MDKTYRNIVYTVYQKISMLEFDFMRNNIDSREKYITKLSIFKELIGYEKPNYIMINKMNNAFLIDKSLLNFTNNILMNRLEIDYSIKNILILTDQEKFRKCRNLKISNALIFLNPDDIYQYIINREKCSL